MAILSSDEIVRLSPTERLSLIAQLWDSLEQHHLPLNPAQEAELDRRLASVEEDGSHGISWPSLSPSSISTVPSVRGHLYTGRSR